MNVESPLARSSAAPIPGQDFIDDADVRALCGNKASAVSQKNNQSDGTHVRGFTAHVRAGNDVQTMLGIEIAVIRYIVLDRFFNDRVPGALDLNRGHRNEIRLDPTVRIGVLSKKKKAHQGR